LRVMDTGNSGNRRRILTRYGYDKFRNAAAAAGCPLGDNPVDDRAGVASCPGYSQLIDDLYSGFRGVIIDQVHPAASCPLEGQNAGPAIVTACLLCGLHLMALPSRWTCAIREPRTFSRGRHFEASGQRFCLKLITVVWVLGALVSWFLLNQGLGSATMDLKLFAYSLPGIIFAIPALLITWLSVGFRWAPLRQSRR